LPRRGWLTTNRAATGTGVTVQRASSATWLTYDELRGNAQQLNRSTRHASGALLAN
jgi:hypothetical protein